MAKAVDSQCRTFQLAIQVLGRSWNALILNVLQEGPLRFSELSGRAKGPGDKVLSARLKDLEAGCLHLPRVRAGAPGRVSYEFERSRGTLGGLPQAIDRWGEGFVHGASPRPR